MFDEFLRSAAGSDDFADVVGLRVAEGVLAQIDLLELLEWPVVLRRHESKSIEVYILRILRQSSMSETRSRMMVSRLRTSRVLMRLP